MTPFPEIRFEVADSRVGNDENMVEANKAVQDAADARKKTIDAIMTISAAVDATQKTERNTAIAGGAVSMAGTVLGIAGGIVTIATAGAAAAPLAVAWLMWSGAGVSVVGGITKAVGGIVGASEQKKLMDKLEKAIENDNKAQQRLEKCLDPFKESSCEKTKYRVFIKHLIPGIAGVANSYGYSVGGLALVKEISKRIPSLLQHLKDETVVKLLGDQLIEVVIPLVIRSIEVAAQAGVNVTDDIAVGAVGNLSQGPTKKIAFNAAKTAAEAAIKEGGDDAAKALAATAAARLEEQLAAEAAKKAAQHASKAAAKTAAKKATEAALAQAAKTAAEEAAELAVEEGAKRTAQAALQKATEVAAAKTAEKVAAEAALQAAKETAKTATENVVKKVAETAAAKGAAEAAVKTAAETAAKQASQSVLKTMARVTGGVTIGLGALVIAWDAYSMYKDCNKESLGDALRRLAKSLEDTAVQAG